MDHSIKTKQRFSKDQILKFLNQGNELHLRKVGSKFWSTLDFREKSGHMKHMLKDQVWSTLIPLGIEKIIQIESILFSGKWPFLRRKPKWIKIYEKNHNFWLAEITFVTYVMSQYDWLRVPSSMNFMIDTCTNDMHPSPAMIATWKKFSNVKIHKSIYGWYIVWTWVYHVLNTLRYTIYHFRMLPRRSICMERKWRVYSYQASSP